MKSEFTDYQLAYWTIPRHLHHLHQWDRRDSKLINFATSHPDLHRSHCTHTTLGNGPNKMPRHRVEDESQLCSSSYSSKLLRRHLTTSAAWKIATHYLNYIIRLTLNNQLNGSGQFCLLIQLQLSKFFVTTLSVEGAMANVGFSATWQSATPLLVGALMLAPPHCHFSHFVQFIQSTGRPVGPNLLLSLFYFN